MLRNKNDSLPPSSFLRILRFFRFAFFAIIGFIIPLALVIYISGSFPKNGISPEQIGSSLFDTAADGIDSARTRLDPQESPTTKQSSPIFGLNVAAPGSYLSLNDSLGIDPKSNGYFLLSFRILLRDLPLVGVRQNILEKYEAHKFPYPGWSFGLSNLGTSIRPEFYWRAKNETGGWYTFADTELRLNQWYTFTILAKDGEFASAFIEDSNNSSSTHEQASSSENLKFLGGADLSGVGLPGSASSCNIGAFRTMPGSFSGWLSSILIALPNSVPDSLEGLEELFSGGPERIAGSIGDESVRVYLDRRMESLPAGSMNLSGPATWTNFSSN